MDDEVITTGHRILEKAVVSGCCVRLLGGVAIAERCRRALSLAPELHRKTNDIDLVGLRSERERLEAFFCDLGLEPQREINVLSGGERLLYTMGSAGNTRMRIDVVLERLVMCHVLELGPRLRLHPCTISATDLLLSKLQVVFPAERDVQDILAILATFDLVPTADEPDHLETPYISALCGADWGWHRTATTNLRRIEGWAAILRNDAVRAIVLGRARALASALDGCKKDLRWRVRNLVGERLRWYETPEENKF